MDSEFRKRLITEKTREERPEFAKKLMQYQLKAKDILADAFSPINNIAFNQICNPSEISLGELASYLKIMDRIAHRQNLAPHKIAENFKKIKKCLTSCSDSIIFIVATIRKEES